MTRTAGEFVGSWRAALRVARRSTLRHRGRSALILMMLFLPAYAATVLAVSWANLSGTSAQEVTFRMGQADLIVDDGDVARSSLPSNSRSMPSTRGRTVVAGPAGLAAFEYEATDLDDPLNRGRYVLRAGRAPQGAAEVAVTRALARELDIRPGNQVVAGMPQRSLTVVGVVDWSRSLHSAGLLVPAEAPLSGARAELLVKLPAGQSWSPPESSTTTNGFSFMLREDLKPTVAEKAMEAGAVLLVTTFAGAQVVLLVGAAFVVGARRQRRDLAMIAAVGGTGRQVGRIVLAGGLLLGAAAAIAGAGAGLLTFTLAGPLIEAIADHPLIDVSVPVPSVAGVTVVMLTIGVLAALLPARTAGRGPVRADLGGQRTRSRLDLAALAVGMILLAAGTAALVLAGHPEGRIEILALGGVAQLVGVVACAPTLVRLAGRVAAALPLSGRLALRHGARHRLRTAAAIAAITAATAGSVSLAIVGTARNDAPATPLRTRPGQIVLEAETLRLLGEDGLRRFTAALPTREIVTLKTTTDTSTPLTSLPPEGAADPRLIAAFEQRRVAVGGAEIVHLVTGRPANAQELDILADGGAVVFNDTLIADTQIILTKDGKPLPSLPALLAVRGDYYPQLPGLVISAATARRLNLTVATEATVIDPTRQPGPKELTAANDVLLRAQLNTRQPLDQPVTAAATQVSAPAEETTTMFYLLAAISALVTLVASTVAVGLASVELRPDLATMTAVGATPQTRRRITAAQSALIAGIGAVLGLLAGLGPAAAYISYSINAHWHTPWLALLLIAATPPALTTFLTGLLTRGQPRLTRRTN
ncbi:ABC transporter permease [Micromonospora sp. NBC_00362]|uniref:FtsX-like permease family protein n=1 Tax=Micromonospora sp. NBC_00362 TaxID=2975975 RepID=UPI002250C782|nr:FtsX-like permease family protein [Micromonospora sp. NBC_00362]MCX5122080.1 ABC transporter permease [Micromonospora sp. NBC_00362]